VRSFRQSSGSGIPRRTLFLCLVLLISVVNSDGQKKQKQSPHQVKTKPAAQPSELEKLRQEYIEKAKDYKASLEKLRVLYEADERKAETRLTQSNDLYKQGLISKVQLEDSDHAVAIAKGKVSEVQQRMNGADTQIAQAVVEIEGDKQMAKLGRVPKGGFVRTASFIRYGGAGPWLLSQAGTIETFFLQRFGRPLPIAVFGQGAIHNQWRLDHHNAMDVSLNPDGSEAQVLMDFLRRSGIPFSAFRTAIPGVATGPHIHIGLPSHRY